ncbi:MAG TPA: YfbM family protein [Pyrinomonadaceae bacterium]|nr:YfbM family protein [Pyrinomonadaceae bacterium]
MGMVLALVALSDANIARLLQDPPLVWRAIAPDEPEAYEKARTEKVKQTLWSKLFRRTQPMTTVPDLEMSGVEGLNTDLDKAWHGIHYLLTGTAWEGDYPRNFLVKGGTEVGDIDVGYGTARVLTAAQTREVLDALNGVSDEDLEARFDPQDMVAKEIYPEIWDRDPEEDDTFGYLTEYFQVLRGFLSQTVDEGLGLVVYFS